MLYSPEGEDRSCHVSPTPSTNRRPLAVTRRRNARTICRTSSLVFAWLCFQPGVFGNRAEVDVLPERDQELAGHRDDPTLRARRHPATASVMACHLAWQDRPLNGIPSSSSHGASLLRALLLRNLVL